MNDNSDSSTTTEDSDNVIPYSTIDDLRLITSPFYKRDSLARDILDKLLNNGGHFCYVRTNHLDIDATVGLRIFDPAFVPFLIYVDDVVGPPIDLIKPRIPPFLVRRKSLVSHVSNHVLLHKQLLKPGTFRLLFDDIDLMIFPSKMLRKTTLSEGSVVDLKYEFGVS